VSRRFDPCVFVRSRSENHRPFLMGVLRRTRISAARLLGVILLTFIASSGEFCKSLHGQQPPNETASTDALPDTPGGQITGPESTAHKSSSFIAGTVLDVSGAEVQGARIDLNRIGGGLNESAQSGGDGQFLFHGLPEGKFKLKVSGPGWGTYVSPEIELHAGDFRIVSDIVLPPEAAVTQIRVVGDKEELAEEQVHIALQQRILGVFPNFYSSYDWNAPPLQAKQKFQLAYRSLIDPVTFLGAGAVAGIEQVNNSFPGFGSGAQGYAKRYGAAYADDVTARLLSSALLPTVFREDPRYFYRGSGSTRSRAFYAVSAAVIARGDNGRWKPNYARILGSFASGGISNLYYPSGSRGTTLVFENGLIDLASYAGSSLVREFVLKRFTTRAQQ